MKDIAKYVFGEAAKSNIDKRKVGCVITELHKDGSESILVAGHNNDKAHAEVVAIGKVLTILGHHRANSAKLKVYVSHEPCPACAKTIADTLGTDTKVEVVKPFMKFDGDKLRYDLIPPSAMKGLAEVLTYGARKYKPRNYMECEDKGRFVAALYRHLEAWRQGEVNDTESDLEHLAHAMTNIAIIMELENK